MIIHFDISHPAHLNFFKHAIHSLHNQGHSVILTVLDRGRLIAIAENEFEGMKIYRSGRHKGGLYSIVIEANILKFFRLLGFFIRHRPHVTLSCGGFVAGFIMKIFNRPNFQFDDDPERKANVRLEKLTSTLLFFPPVIAPEGKIRLFNAVKEWAYLSPAYFKPDMNVLNMFGLSPGEYLFIREVSRETLNYMDQDKKKVIENLIRVSDGKKVLLSLEKKSDRSLYPEDWILLTEPVSDIHSLIYYSNMLISSGDSMAREASLLGVHAFYCGGRKMAVNNFISSTGFFHDIRPEDLAQEAGNVNYDKKKQAEKREQLLYSWDDMTEMIIKLALNTER